MQVFQVLRAPNMGGHRNVPLRTLERILVSRRMALRCLKRQQPATRRSLYRIRVVPEMIKNRYGLLVDA